MIWSGPKFRSDDANFVHWIFKAKICAVCAFFACKEQKINIQSDLSILTLKRLCVKTFNEKEKGWTILAVFPCENTALQTVPMQLFSAINFGNLMQLANYS